MTWGGGELAIPPNLGVGKAKGGVVEVFRRGPGGPDAKGEMCNAKRRIKGTKGRGPGRI